MSHKKTADDNPQINFCGYPLILLSESGFQKSYIVISWAHDDREGFGLAVIIAGGKSTNRLARSPLKGMERLPEDSTESMNFFQKSEKNFKGLHEAVLREILFMTNPPSRHP